MARQQLRPQGVGHQRRQHRQVQHGQRLAPAHARHHAHHGVPAVDQHGQPQEGQHRRGAAPGYESEGIVARRLAAGQAHDQPSIVIWPGPSPRPPAITASPTAAPPNPIQ
ncbi:hypothetical protein G6F56_014165 [Rhizopus delemar]|nr:hypothetical protein G6F56_014165 [Rhizopus delemar]